VPGAPRFAVFETWEPKQEGAHPERRRVSAGVEGSRVARPRPRELSAISRQLSVEPKPRREPGLTFRRLSCADN